jgi:hypothetical protein
MITLAYNYSSISHCGGISIKQLYEFINRSFPFYLFRLYIFMDTDDFIGPAQGILIRRLKKGDCLKGLAAVFSPVHMGQILENCKKFLDNKVKGTYIAGQVMK